MVRKLFEHIGLIDLNKIVETYGNDEGGFDTQSLFWQPTHLRKCLDGYCECPPALIGPEEPRLKTTRQWRVRLFSPRDPTAPVRGNVSIIDPCFRSLAVKSLVEAPRAKMSFG